MLSISEGHVRVVENGIVPMNDNIMIRTHERHVVRNLIELTQVELAEAAGTSQPTIAAYEAGRKSPTLRTLRRLAEAVGLEATVAFHRPMVREDPRSLHLHRAIARRLERTEVYRSFREEESR